MASFAKRAFEFSGADGHKTLQYTDLRKAVTTKPKESKLVDFEFFSDIIPERKIKPAVPAPPPSASS